MSIKEKIVAAMLLLGSIALLFGCGNSSSQEKTTEDEVKIVSLAPSATSILYELGAQKNLIGCTTYCTTDPADSIEVVSDILTPNLERIIALKPNIVITTTMMSRQHVENLRKFNIEVLPIGYPNSIDEVYDQFRNIATSIGKEAVADSLIMQEKVWIESTRSANLERPEHTLFFQLGANPLWAATQGTFLSECAEICRFKNISSKENGGMISKEFVVSLDPKALILILMKEIQQSELAGWMEFKSMKAVKENNILILSDSLCQPTPKNIRTLIKSIDSFAKSIK